MPLGREELRLLYFLKSEKTSLDKRSPEYSALGRFAFFPLDYDDSMMSHMILGMSCNGYVSMRSDSGKTYASLTQKGRGLVEKELRSLSEQERERMKEGLAYGMSRRQRGQIGPQKGA